MKGSSDGRGKHYPITQFTLWQWEGECDDEWHYHTNSGHAVNVDLLGLSDPDPENCGFGKTNEISEQVVQMTDVEVAAFLSETGIDPVGTEAQMGGSGP